MAQKKHKIVENSRSRKKHTFFPAHFVFCWEFCFSYVVWVTAVFSSALYFCVARVCTGVLFLFTLGLHAAIWTSALFRSKRLERAAYSFKLRWAVRGARRGSPMHVHAHSCQDLRRPLHVRAEIGRSLRGPLHLLAG